MLSQQTFDLITATGLIASLATAIQIVFGQGGQLLRLGQCSALEIRGIHCGAFAINVVSHGLWTAYGAGAGSTFIFLPNALGATLSAVIVVRVLTIRRSSTHPCKQPESSKVATLNTAPMR